MTTSGIQNSQELSPYKASTEKLDEQNQNDKLVLHSQTQKHISVGEFIKSAVYGGLDGIVTTLTIVLPGIGSVGNGNTHHILALGFSALLGNAVSMAFADFLGSKSDQQYMQTQQQREREQIINDFEAQKKQMLGIYQELGLQPNISQQIVDILSSNKQGFLKIMLIEELQLLSQQNALMNAVKNSIVTFFSFSIFGLMPLIPIIVAQTHSAELNNNYLIAVIIISAFFFFILGFSKSFVTGVKWYKSAFQTIVIGTIAAGASYGIGKGIGQ